VEPTDHCNLDCVTCYRNNWAEALGRMTNATYGRILDGIKDLDPKPTIFFGGVGEPTLHTRLPDWIAQAKALGCSVEMITNGTLLTETLSRKLIAAGLDLLWVSIDGATPESYADVRMGAELPNVLHNLSVFRRLRGGEHFPRPEIGVAFVAMERNIDDLPAVLKIAQRGAMHSSQRVMPSTTARGGCPGAAIVGLYPAPQFAEAAFTSRPGTRRQGPQRLT
jgi:MoaA/NifB/PqqE/SkfB family radical SAM enzyme